MKMYMTVPIQYPQKSSHKTEKTAYNSTAKTVHLEFYTATSFFSFPAFSMSARALFADGIPGWYQAK